MEPTAMRRALGNEVTPPAARARTGMPPVHARKSRQIFGAFTVIDAQPLMEEVQAGEPRACMGQEHVQPRESRRAQLPACALARLSPL